MKPGLFAHACTALALSALTACSTPQPHRYEEIASSSQLRENSDARRDRVPYAVNKNVAWASYSQVILDPVTLYGGQDGQFDDISLDERRELSDYMFNAFAEQLTRRFRLVRTAEPATLRIRLTLTGAAPNTAMISTFTRFDLVGAPYNAVQGVRGKEGVFMGAVMYSVEIFDASTGELLSAFVAKQFPNAMNILATFGRLKAAQVGIDKGAAELVAWLR